VLQQIHETVAGVRVAAGVAPAGFGFPIRRSLDPPIRQAQRPAATQEIAGSFLRRLRVFAAAIKAL
jgi:hypothetical protein